MQALRVCAALLAAFLTAPASAQGCGPYEEVRKYLGEKYGESVIGRGIANGGLFELWLNPETGSWTVLGRPRPDVACPLSGGTDWEFAMPAAQGRPS